MDWPVNLSSKRAVQWIFPEWRSQRSVSSPTECWYLNNKKVGDVCAGSAGADQSKRKRPAENLSRTVLLTISAHSLHKLRRRVENPPVDFPYVHCSAIRKCP